jgi:hypothetical protein
MEASKDVPVHENCPIWMDLGMTEMAGNKNLSRLVTKYGVIVKQP